MKKEIVKILIRIIILLLLCKALFYMTITCFWGLMPNDVFKDVIESISEIILIITCFYLLFRNAFAIFGRKRKNINYNYLLLSFVSVAVLFSVLVQLYNLIVTVIPYSIAYHHYVDILIPHILILVFGSYFVWVLLANIINHKKTVWGEYFESIMYPMEKTSIIRLFW